MSDHHTMPLSAATVWRQSLPIMLANAAAPVVGLVDTFVIGRYAGTSALAGIGLGAVIYGIAYWGFGFLRMSTAGLAAQSDGAGDKRAVQAHLYRAVPLGLLIGLLILALQIPLLAGAFKIYTASGTIESAAAEYIRARLWGLPATLASVALMGWFVGIGRPGAALQMQIVLNIVNAALSFWFVADLGWGLSGVGRASAIAEWVGLIAGLCLALSEIRRRGGLDPSAREISYLTNREDLSKLGITNGNIFLRTVTLTIGFNFFANAAASQGEVFLAANHIHMQFITMAALILDAFAHTAEAVTGAAYGARDKTRFHRAVNLTALFAAGGGIICGLLIYLIGPFAAHALSDDPAVHAAAQTYLPFCALAPVLGFAAWQFDGIYIGTTKSREMRDAAALALLIYLVAHFALAPSFGPVGIWLAFLVYYMARGLMSAVFYPSVLRDLESRA